MCYYNGQKVTRAEFIRLKQLEKEIAKYDFLQNDLHQGFDYGANVVLRRMPDKEDFDLTTMEWGFIPPYIKSREEVQKMRNGYYDEQHKFHPGYTFLNAMSEELLKPGKMWADATRNRRCLILSSGFYEWRHFYPIGKRTGKPLKTPIRYPYHITLTDREYFYMAGIYQPWTDITTGEYVETSAIVTTEANHLMAQIHNTKKRMPTILNEDLAYEWLFGKLDDGRINHIAKSQYPSREMQAYPVRKDFLAALEPTKEHEYEDLPALELSL